jgi:hypothetical protein
MTPVTDRPARRRGARRGTASAPTVAVAAVWWNDASARFRVAEIPTTPDRARELVTTRLAYKTPTAAREFAESLNAWLDGAEALPISEAVDAGPHIVRFADGVVETR